MKLLKKMSFLLFASLVMVSCSSDDDVDPSGPVITGLDFTITATGSGNTVEVLPSAMGATSYSVDFGSDATDDVFTTVGPKVSYTYARAAASYDITVTASAAGADNVIQTTTYAVVVEVSALEGRWVIKHDVAALLMLNPLNTNESWWNNSFLVVSARSCFFDDVYEFSADGSFKNILGDETWLEGSWAGNDEMCGAPYAPFDGTTPGKWSHDSEAKTITISGRGSFLGFATIQNGKSITDAANAVDGITYSEVTFNEEKNEMSVFIDGGAAAWQWTFAKEGSTGASLPTTDSDGDGVIDIDDACPDVSGTQADGCPPPQPPAVSASAPTALQANVLSIYSDTYTGTDPTSWFQSWGSGTLEDDLVIDTNNIKAYSNLVFQAVGLASTVDLSSFTTVHVDVYTQTENVFKLKIADFGADNLDEYPNVDDTESEVESETAQTAGVWVGHNIPLASFTGLGSTLNVGQLQVVLGTEGNVWIDNIYFY
jgi:hypothetical protein